MAIDSVNPDLVPGGAGEAEIARFIAGWLEAAGLDVHLEDAESGRPSVVGVARGRGGGRSLMLNAHVDTVGVEGMERPFEPRIEAGRLYGRGAVDMKSGLAAILLAGAWAVKAELAGDVIVTCVADEEVASRGTEAVLRRWRADAAIVTEPTELDVCIAHKGFVWADVETQGRAAHGSRPDLGVDAIVKMGPILSALGTLDQRLCAQPTHPLLGSGSVHASLISGGQELSSYPAACKVRLERRTIPGETPATLERELAELTGGDANFEIGFSREPFEVDPEEPIVQAVRAQAERVRGAAPRLYGATFWADTGLIQAAGIPTLLFGPGGAGEHSIVEWADLAQLEACVEILTAVAEEFCAEPAARLS